MRKISTLLLNFPEMEKILAPNLVGLFVGKNSDKKRIYGQVKI